MNPYYGVRRLGPYLGVIQVIDVGDACAYSTNGQTWRVRQQTASGHFRWGVTQVSDENVDQVRIVNADNLVEALRKRPPVPFPIRDRYELWLLNKKTRKPLALLRTRYKAREMEAVSDPHWRPFLMTDTDFVSPTLQERSSEGRGAAGPRRIVISWSDRSTWYRDPCPRPSGSSAAPTAAALVARDCVWRWKKSDAGSSATTSRNC